ncbi:MAG: putative beta-lysine N-acetyltransferase [Spirochaetaceae bacterium]
MSNDSIEVIGTARIQHGRANDRVYIMEAGSEEPSVLIAGADTLASRHSYGKLFAKVPAGRAAAFFAAGWRLEAFVPGLFSCQAAGPEHAADAEDGFFVVKYLDSKRERRREEPEHIKLMESFAGLLQNVSPGASKPMPRSFVIRSCTHEDAPVMAEVFAEVFSSYPFPVDDPGFVRETMAEGTDYFCVELQSGSKKGTGGGLIALSSAERNDAHGYAEMTDFAVLPEYRGLGISGVLLKAMEEGAKSKNIRTAFTIARLHSAGMNATFLKAGYSYGGTLFANTSMPEGLESMNVLYKKLQ